MEGKRRELLIKGALVVDPAQGLEDIRDLLIDGDKIAALEPPGTIPAEGRRVIEAQGLVVTPGLIDMHVHLREPGEEYKETILTGDPGRGPGRLHRGGLHAQHQAGERHRLRDPLHPGPGRRKRGWPGSTRWRPSPWAPRAGT